MRQQYEFFGPLKRGQIVGAFTKTKENFTDFLFFFFSGYRLHNINADRPVCDSVLPGVHDVFPKGKTQASA